MEPIDPKLVALLGPNLRYLDELYERYQQDPASVDPGFRELLGLKDVPEAPRAGGAAVGGGTVPASGSDQALAFQVRELIEAYRRYGHTRSRLDPLEIEVPTGHPSLELGEYGLGDGDLDRPVPQIGLVGSLAAAGTVRELVAALDRTYCGVIGAEFMHISDPTPRRFLQEWLESVPNRFSSSRDDQVRILDRLADAEVLEQFIHTKYVSARRFSLEGGKALIPLIDFAFEFAGAQGVEEVVIGMAHRGRLNVLANLMGKSPRLIFAEFEDIDPASVMGAGDVKYHMGYSTDHRTRGGHKMHLSLTFNPSHLEAVDPVVLGRVRAKQRRHGDDGRQRVLSVLIHGDAAFAGQGLVAETLNLSQLEGYFIGGTLHVVVNNQIGFTTSPRDSRSTRYCTDVAKMLDVPILHVNGGDPEAVVYAVDLAMAYRAQFHTDVIIDLVCYRRYGHNETDEPSFTQPVMYQKIDKMPNERQLYSTSLVGRGVIAAAEVDAMIGRKQAILEQELQVAKLSTARARVEAFTGVWQGFTGGLDSDTPDVATGVPMDRLQEIARRVTTVPADFTPHPKIERLLQQRAAMGRGDQPLDWGMGETMAFGSLMWDGVLVRLSGQDARRGTFSSRHAVLFNKLNGATYTPLAHLRDEQKDAAQGQFRIYDSMLSEAAVLGFEYGYSLDYPDGLVMWEAQFGDFVNGAQVILDQFISSAEDKWRRLSGVVLLLPHGYEGQGPEHSSARFERFLQLCAEDNMQVVYPTTPGQYFHLLRRQVVRPWRKPLVVMSPKSLLRHPAATSQMDELAHGSFQCVLGDPTAQPESVTRVMLCTGKVYFDLVEARKKRGDDKTAIVRIEQLYPLRTAALNAVLASFPNTTEYVWVQEEPANMGALTFILPRLQAILKRPLRAASRVESASPATGSHKAHVMELTQLMNDAFGESK